MFILGFCHWDNVECMKTCYKLALKSSMIEGLVQLFLAISASYTPKWYVAGVGVHTAQLSKKGINMLLRLVD